MIARHFKQFLAGLAFLSSVLFISCNSNKEKQAEIPTETNVDTTTTPPPAPERKGPIGGERTEGSVTVRDSINGRILFKLDNDIRVSATAPKNGWTQIGVLVDLTQLQYDSLYISKGTTLLSDGKKVGEVLERIELQGGGYKTEEGFKGELVGYTYESSLNPLSIPENELVALLNSPSLPNSLAAFSFYIRGFGLSSIKALGDQYNILGIDETWVNDPSPMLRIWLVFKGNDFCGLFHSRPLALEEYSTVPVKRGLFFSARKNANAAVSQDLVNSFNSFIQQVD